MLKNVIRGKYGLVCSFTGHRKIKKEHKGALPSLVARAIAYAYSKGVRTFLCGGAVGFDTCAAREVIKFRISHPDVRLVLALPCVEQDKLWSDAERDAYEYTLAVANEIIYVSEEYTPSCMRERNMRLASEADILVCYVGNSRSGAAQTVRMAERLGKEIYNLYPTLDKALV